MSGSGSFPEIWETVHRMQGQVLAPPAKGLHRYVNLGAVGMQDRENALDHELVLNTRILTSEHRKLCKAEASFHVLCLWLDGLGFCCCFGFGFP